MVSVSEPKPYSGPLRAVVLDWAGTCVDFGSCAPAAVFVESFARHDVQITLAHAREPMGMAKRDHIAAIGAIPEVADRWRRRHARAFNDADIDAIYATFLPLQTQCVERFSAVIPGAAQAVTALRARGLRIGSSTGYTREIIDRVAAGAARQGLTTDCTLCASDIPQGRPWPWMIFENMRRLGVCPPGAVVTVDDTTVGIEAARNAGTWAVGIAATGNVVGLDQDAFESLPDAERTQRVAAARATLHNAGAHLVIDSIAELPEAVRRIEDRQASVDAPRSFTS